MHLVAGSPRLRSVDALCFLIDICRIGLSRRTSLFQSEAPPSCASDGLRVILLERSELRERGEEKYGYLPPIQMRG